MKPQIEKTEKIETLVPEPQEQTTEDLSRKTTEPSTKELASTLCLLKNKYYIMTKEDMKTCWGIISREEWDATDRKTLKTLEDTYKHSSTYTWKPIENPTPKKIMAEIKSKKMVDEESLQQIIILYPNAKWLVFQNKVGNYKPVVVIEIEGKKWVIKKCRDNEYPKKYTEIQKAENRPEMKTIEINGSLFGLFEFIEGELPDFSNPEHLQEMVSLSIHSARRHTTFDPNPGNLKRKNGKLYYLDVDIKYTKSKKISSALLANIAHIAGNIPENKSIKEIKMELINTILNFFHIQIPLILNQEEQQALQSNPPTEAEIKDELRHLLKPLEQEEQEEIVQQTLKALALPAIQ